MTGYTVTAVDSVPAVATTDGDASQVIVSGLVPGVSYRFSVTATNAVGPGPASPPTEPITAP